MRRPPGGGELERYSPRPDTGGGPFFSWTVPLFAHTKDLDVKRRAPTPPKHLSDRAKSWWKSVHASFELEEHHCHLLRLACESLDRCEEAREILAREGITFRDDRGNVRAHPAVAIEKDARIAAARLIRELDLDVEPPAESPRPPGLRSNRRL